MDFGKEDFELLTIMQNKIDIKDWDLLMGKRLDVIVKDAVIAENGNTTENQNVFNEVCEKYEELKQKLKIKYNL